jgi:hypothetical protein
LADAVLWTLIGLELERGNSAPSTWTSSDPLRPLSTIG